MALPERNPGYLKNKEEIKRNRRALETGAQPDTGHYQRQATLYQKTGEYSGLLAHGGCTATIVFNCQCRKKKDPRGIKTNHIRRISQGAIDKCN
jgi:hypothetical protein